jgi:3-phenylpropionate/cinnamic acid dioxygenase small subunit
MTNEEIEKAMQFILEQQAQFAANQQQLGERVTRLETNMAEMARAQTHMNEVIADMGRAQTHMNEVVAVMADTHRHTEEKLDAFIGVLERYISEGRNGKGHGEDAT